MANDDLMGFDMTSNNYLNTRDSIGLDEHNFSVIFRGDTMSTKGTIYGAGVSEGIIDTDDQTAFRNMRTSICSMKEPMTVRPGNPASFSASVTCPDGREINGLMDIPSLPKSVGAEVLSPTRDMVAKFYNEGTPVARLDASVDIKPMGGKLLFTFKFKNSGESAKIVFNSPEVWGHEAIAMTKNSEIGVGGGLVGSDDSDFDIRLGSDEFINKVDYPNGIVEIPPGQIRYLKFLAIPDNRLKHGRYVIGATVTICVVLAPEKLKGAVEFSIENSFVEIPHDFPSNDADMQKFEQYRRELLFNRPKSIGTQVEETGYYRAYGMDDKDRDDFPQLLRKGEKFPERTMERRDGGSHKEIGPAKLWRWDAYPDAKVSAHTGEPCPRAGRWVPQMAAGMSASAWDVFKAAGGPRELKSGERMPRLGLESGAISWTWIGPPTSA